MNLNTIKERDHVAILAHCYAFAAEKHKQQRRKDKKKGKRATPYINHPIDVAKYAATIGGIRDLATILACILHDVYEDTDTTYEEVVFNFGKEVANIVKEVSDDKSLPPERRKRLQVMHTSELSDKAKVVKLCDSISNLLSLIAELPNGWNQERRYGYFVWKYFVLRNITGVNRELESYVNSLIEHYIPSETSYDVLSRDLDNYYELIRLASLPKPPPPSSSATTSIPCSALSHSSLVNSAELNSYLDGKYSMDKDITLRHTRSTDSLIDNTPEGIITSIIIAITTTGLISALVQ
jgi:GTP diphosphokinase / guanosine-3',5'-bis(diphosphate) 3'-diphosphatase